jgi:hypothetical protein
VEVWRTGDEQGGDSFDTSELLFCGSRPARSDRERHGGRLRTSASCDKGGGLVANPLWQFDGSVDLLTPVSSRPALGRH